MERLEVEGGFSGAEGGSMDPKREGGPLVSLDRDYKKKEVKK